MARHLKTSVISDLTSTVFRAVPSPAVSTYHARGVRYFEPIVAIKFFCGIMNSYKKGQKYRKHIIVRRAPHRKGLHQLYTYHFPKTWSAACVANRELIKLAQKRAHALEHDHSFVGIEWRIRFFKHYYRVFNGGAAPEPGLKPYSRFYQYTYVAIYRELQAARQEILDRQASSSSLSAQGNRPALEPSDITVSPLEQRSFSADIIRHSSALSIARSPALYHHISSSLPPWRMCSGKNVLLRMGNAKARVGGTTFLAE